VIRVAINNNFLTFFSASNHRRYNYVSSPVRSGNTPHQKKRESREEQNRERLRNVQLNNT